MPSPAQKWGERERKGERGRVRERDRNKGGEGRGRRRREEERGNINLPIAPLVHETIRDQFPAPSVIMDLNRISMQI